MEFEWKSMVQSINLGKINPLKQYGLYKRNGKTFSRNYHRELKNGKGLNAADLLNFKINQVGKQICIDLRRAFVSAIYL